MKLPPKTPLSIGMGSTACPELASGPIPIDVPGLEIDRFELIQKFGMAYVYLQPIPLFLRKNFTDVGQNANAKNAEGTHGVRGRTPGARLF